MHGHVATRRPYLELVSQAGFVNAVETDVTDDYAQTQQAWIDASESRADALRQLTSDREFTLGQADRRLTHDAIAQGLLRRSLITATRH